VTATTRAPAADTRRAAVVVAIVGFVVYLALVGIAVGTHQGEAAWFVKFGETSSVTDYGRQVLGNDLVVPFGEGHDGTSFWLLARDPLLVHPEESAAQLDRPGYRAQRILYPLLASPWRLGGEQSLLWGMVAVNLAVVGLGGYLAARLAQQLGASAWVGLAFAANPLVLLAVMLDLSETVALAGLVAAVLAIRRGRWGWGTVAGALAVLAKEPMLLGLAGLALGASTAAGATMARRVRLVAVPIALSGAWALYARWRLGWPSLGVEELVAVPFGGWVDAGRFIWEPLGRWSDAVIGFGVLATAVAVVARWWRRRTIELWASVGFALLVPFISLQVAHLGLNSVRVIGPALTFLVIDGYAQRAAERQPVPSLT